MKGLVVIGVGPSSVPEVAAATERARWDVVQCELTAHARHEALAVEMAAHGWAVVIPEPTRPGWVDDLDACPAVVRWAETWIAEPCPAGAQEGSSMSIEEDRGPCPLCGAPMTRENSSRLRDGAVVHVGCPKNDAALQAAAAPIREAFGVDPALPVGPADPARVPRPAGRRGRGRRPAQHVVPDVAPVPPEPAKALPDRSAMTAQQIADEVDGRVVQLPSGREAVLPGVPCSTTESSLIDVDQGARPPLRRRVTLASPPIVEVAARMLLGQPAEDARRAVGAEEPCAPASEERAAKLAAQDAEEDRNRAERNLKHAIAAEEAGLPVRVGHGDVFDGALVREVEEVAPGAVVERLGPFLGLRLPPGTAVGRAADATRLVQARNAEAARELDDRRRSGMAQLSSEDVDQDAGRQIEPPTIHLLVPGFAPLTGTVCCGCFEAPKPGVELPVTTLRKDCTCAGCLEVHDDVEALGERLLELEPEPTPEEQAAAEIAEERAQEEADLERRRIAQLALLDAPLPPAPSPDALIHVFEPQGWGGLAPNVSDPNARRDAGPDTLVARCGIRTNAPSSLMVWVFEDPGHPRVCSGCKRAINGSSASPGSRAAFVSPEQILPPRAPSDPEPGYPAVAPVKRGRRRR